ncbi:MAG: VWA domain-containing protein, partial [Desulfobacteraceae bacterium]|nr:VWA domain-containing protein [Desulfobacteraceae bacterium]
FILNYRLAGETIASGLQLYEGENENFFLLTVQPPKRVTQEMIPAREYIFIVDVSGSMNGFPLNTAKKLMTDLLGNLRPEDRFNVILFAGCSNLMSPSSVPADKTNIEQALALIDRQKGGGGTKLYNAVKTGLSLPYDESISRSMIIVTDGFISAEKDVFQLIHGQINKANVFTFGIGSSVNRFLIEGMAKAGQGAPFIVTKPGEAKAAAQKLRQYVSTPVLTSIKMTTEDFDAYSVEPAIFADLLGQRPLVVFGKYRGEAKGKIRMSGISGMGRFEKEVDVASVLPLSSNKTLSYLWARKRIDRLSDHNFSKESKENKLEITNLGLTYNLLTRHTSFIAVHDVARNPQANAKDVKQPLPLPFHVSNLAVGGNLSAVPEPELYLMLILLGVGACIRIIRKKRGE